MFKNHKIRKVLVLSSVDVFALLCAGCQTTNKNQTKDYGLMLADNNVHNATINSIVSSDIYGRSFDEGDVASSDKKVGMFYFVWLGEHTDQGIFDVTKYSQTEDGKKALWSEIEMIDPEGSITNPSNYKIKEEFDADGNPITPSPLFTFHYFSEPLYGYYCSDDPWVIARHIELLTMSGIDYISLDLTNISIYEENIKAVLDSLLKFQNLGWNVPKVTSFLTGTDKALNHPGRILDFYNIFYTDSKYDSLWLRDEETNKPIIAIDRFAYYSGLSPIVTANLKIKNTIWPFDKGPSIYDDMSWMDWEYPQRVYENSDGNYMSVSITQHVAGSFGMSVNPHIKNDENIRAKYVETHDEFDTGGKTNYDSNRGRGWDYELNKNVAENAFKGTNFESQWSNALNSSKPIDEVFVTGWNEWIAYKYPVEILHGGSKSIRDVYGKYYNQVDFCDTADEEFSRDIEMTRGGYGDNFYLQNMRNTREFKFNSSKVQYAGAYATNNIQNINWRNAREYLDFTGEVFARNFDRADHQEVYVNNTNRNDIKSTKVSHDGNNLYMQIETVGNIIMEEDKENNMNVLLSLHDSDKPSWNGYQFLLNKTALTQGLGKGSIQGFKNNNFAETEEIGKYDYFLDKNKLSISIPLEALGVKKDQQFTVDFKVADGIGDPTDIMNYYVDGDSAPIGRLNYRYNSKHF